MASKLKSFDLEFQPFIDEMKAMAEVIREYAGAATMERVRGKCNSFSRLQFYIFVFNRVGYKWAINAAETAWRLALTRVSIWFLLFFPSAGALGLAHPLLGLYFHMLVTSFFLLLTI